MLAGHCAPAVRGVGDAAAAEHHWGSQVQNQRHGAGCIQGLAAGAAAGAVPVGLQCKALGYCLRNGLAVSNAAADKLAYLARVFNV
jgi:hypothetical protein